MTPTLQTFARALLAPDLALKRLSRARAVLNGDSLPCLRRTTRFAEAEIAWRGERWLLFLPLSTAGLRRIERTVSALRRTQSSALTDYRLLPGEMQWTDDAGECRHCDLIIQHLPAGLEFEEALLRVPGGTLLAALEALRRELRRLGIVHRNIKAANLRWTEGRFVLLRYHDMCIGTAADDDAEAFEALRRRIEEVTGRSDAVGDVSYGYAVPDRFPGHIRVHNPFEGLRCVEDETGYGYVDDENRPVIPSHFVWAGDFREGLARVQTERGMGLIDRTGRYVIPDDYDIVEYDPATSLSRVCSDGYWADFDYLGRQLTPFSPPDMTREE